MKTKLFTILLLLFATTKVFATVDYLAVNHLTKQLYWADTDHLPGWIAWESIPDGLWKVKEDKYTQMGYRFTTNPFMIEETIAITITLLLLFFWIKTIRRKRKKALL